MLGLGPAHELGLELAVPLPESAVASGLDFGLVDWVAEVGSAAEQ